MKKIFNFLLHKYWTKVWSLLFLGLAVWCGFVYIGFGEEVVNKAEFYNKGMLLLITSLIFEIQYKLGV